VFGAGGRCFPETILKLALTKSEIDVVTDQRGCPTYTVDLARAIIQLCRKNAQGIVHTTNQGDCTWFEFAREIVAVAGLPTKINPTTSDKFVRPAKRPKYSVLSRASLKHYQLTMPTWQDALQRYLAERNSS
jgi:dTDP-4-dehydrorhamnose reductase